MTIDRPIFPTPENERRASRLYAALRELANIDNDILATGMPGMKKPAEAGSTVRSNTTR